MTLRARLTLLVAMLVAATALLMGGSAVQVSYLTGLHSIDTALDTVATRAAAAKQDGLTSALYAASLQQQPIAVALLTSAAGATWVRGGEEIALPDAVLRRVDRSGAETVDAARSYRMRAARLTDGDLAVLAVDLTPLQSERSTNLRVVLALSALLALLGAAASRLLVRRDLERVRQLTGIADRIASGELHTQLPGSVGVSEVDELAQALDRMVSSLTGSFEELQAAHAHLQTFLGDVSHELRTPLTVVRGYVELLQQSDALEPDVRDRAVRRAMSEIDRMQELISDLLLLAELSERTEPLQEPVDLSAIIRDGVLDLMTLQPTRPVRVNLPERPVTLMGERRGLTSLITNLLGNVARHTPDDAAVRVAVELSDNGLELIIEDGGPGLPPEQYALDMRQLQRFTKLRSETTGGSGLGLRIASTVVGMHGGTLRLLPSDLGGLRVQCTFPTSA